MSAVSVVMSRYLGPRWLLTDALGCSGGAGLPPVEPPANEADERGQIAASAPSCAPADRIERDPPPGASPAVGPAHSPPRSCRPARPTPSWPEPAVVGHLVRVVHSRPLRNPQRTSARWALRLVRRTRPHILEGGPTVPQIYHAPEMSNFPALQAELTCDSGQSRPRSVSYSGVISRRRPSHGSSQ